MLHRVFTALVIIQSLTLVSAVTVYLAGDSTMAYYGANDGDTAGWGLYFPNYVTGITVVNDAVGGESARSYTREGRFTAIANVVKSGDYVVIEFGHNDGGSLTTDNGRTDCGVGSAGYATTCSSTYNGTVETVLTYEAYYANAANLLHSKGANVILCSPTINNPWETGTFAYTASRWTGYASDAASSTGSTYVNHEGYVAQMWQALGASATDADFPNDHTHTGPSGANLVAQSFVTALKASNSSLKNYLIGGTTTTNTKTTATTKTSSSGGACASLYGQCGGIGWTGATCCTGSTCTSSNAYYSQCL